MMKEVTAGKTHLTTNMPSW